MSSFHIVPKLKNLITREEIAQIRAILETNQLRPVIGGTQTDAQHVEHCFHQMIRFANLAAIGIGFRALQFGLNMGRAQEILGSIGGIDCWWRLYEPLLDNGDFEQVIAETQHWLEILNLQQPSNEFINKM